MATAQQDSKLAYRVEEAAAAIGMSKAYVFRLIQNGLLSARKIGTSTVILRHDLETFLASTPVADATKAAQSVIR